MIKHILSKREVGRMQNLTLSSMKQQRVTSQQGNLCFRWTGKCVQKNTAQIILVEGRIGNEREI